MQHARASRPSDRRLRAAETALFKNHEAQLLGPFAASKKNLEWKLGFIARASVTVTPLDFSSFLDHPSAQHLEHLDVTIDHEDAPAAILQLARTPRPSLRSLALRCHHYTHGGTSGEPSYSTEYDQHEHRRGDKLWSALPNLEKLTLNVWNAFHSLRHDKLVELVIEGIPICSSKWNLPKLSRLTWELDCDRTGITVNWFIQAIEALWKGTLPALREVDLRKCKYVGALNFEIDEFPRNTDWCEIGLYTDLEFREFATQLTRLVLPRSELPTKRAIQKWLRDTQQ